MPLLSSIDNFEIKLRPEKKILFFSWKSHVRFLKQFMGASFKSFFPFVWILYPEFERNEDVKCAYIFCSHANLLAKTIMSWKKCTFSSYLVLRQQIKKQAKVIKTKQFIISNTKSYVINFYAPTVDTFILQLWHFSINHISLPESHLSCYDS